LNKDWRLVEFVKNEFECTHRTFPPLRFDEI
jgi:hypothetical protein